VNPYDATAHFLLGSLYLSSGLPDQALQEWEAARRIKPAMQTLHRNMAYAVLRTGGSAQRAADLFREGMQYDSHNVDLYLGLDEALQKLARPASERAAALQAFPDLKSAPTVLVFRLVRLLGEAGEFDQAEKQLENRFFAREEGGANVREVYVELTLQRAKSMAAHGQCSAALDIVRHLGDPVPNMPFTSTGLEPFVSSAASKNAIEEVQASCR